MSISKKSLYGQYDAPHQWYEKLKKGLKDHGFSHCPADPCLFVSTTVISIAYVDNCLWFAKNKADVDAVLQSFKEDGDKFNWEMTEVEFVAEYLGIEITGSATEGFTLHQPH